MGERSIRPVLSGLFPPACPCSLMHLSALQDHKPAVHVSASRTAQSAGLTCEPLLLPQWVAFHVLPKGSRKQDSEYFWWFLVARSAPVSVFGCEQHG